MKEAIGNAFIMGVVITFVIIFMLVFASSLNYTKAFKAKNKIVEILEKYDDVLRVNSTSGGMLTSNVESEINDSLSNMGYKITNTGNDCPVKDGINPVMKQQTANYAYCIYTHSTRKGTYYSVITYVYFDVPLLNISMKFPVYGETKINGILG